MIAQGRKILLRLLRLLLVPGSLLFPFLAGCADDDPAPAERHVARHPRKNELAWKPEASLSLEPQSAPFNVIWEVTRYPGRLPTPEQQRAAERLVARCRESAEAHGWHSFQQGLADGYRLLFGDEVHYVNESYVFDDRVLDPDRPEYLMYYDTRAGKKLVGYMFVVPIGEEGPQLGGPLTLWHYHLWSHPVCTREGRMTIGLPVDGRCEEGMPIQRSPEMLHVWLLEHPEGPFASNMKLTQEVLDQMIATREH